MAKSVTKTLLLSTNTGGDTPGRRRSYLHLEEASFGMSLRGRASLLVSASDALPLFCKHSSFLTPEDEARQPKSDTFIIFSLPASPWTISPGNFTTPRSPGQNTRSGGLIAILFSIRCHRRLVVADRPELPRPFQVPLRSRQGSTSNGRGPGTSRHFPQRRKSPRGQPQGPTRRPSPGHASPTAARGRLVSALAWESEAGEQEAKAGQGRRRMVDFLADSRIRVPGRNHPLEILK